MILTPPSHQLFYQLVQDSFNWSGTPLFDGTQQEKGNLTDLKKKGLVTTWKEEGCLWVDFTNEGRAFAKREFGIDLVK